MGNWRPQLAPQTLSPLAAGAAVFAQALTPAAESAGCYGTANYTAADCPGGSCYAGQPNGCGSRSLSVISADIVPDQWPGGVDFSAACDQHDTCYAMPRSDKAECDQQFLDSMRQECKRALGCVDLPLLGEQCGDNPAQAACNALAQSYYAAVDSLAGGSFDERQQEATAHEAECQT
ncbi:hypothetical protein D9Q98_007836 [Chlorella vulgaris]|uniref:Uncharacterized protein n=1 Tax=Chlorella vulgaris TaxID=3077 RepID=A0A9D4YTJ8_CHLVU|nr:hypothetical protein D9Q98_007836 [Chlorella vulgaris]